MDALEKRQLLTGSPVTLAGTSGDDSWYLLKNGSNIDVWSPIPDFDSSGTPTVGSFPIATTSLFQISGGDGNDMVMADCSAGSLPTIEFTGGGQTDVAEIIGTSNAEDYLYSHDNPDSITPAPVLYGPAVTMYTDAEVIELVPLGGGSIGNGDVIEAYGDNSGQIIAISGDMGPYCDFAVDSNSPPIRFDTSQTNPNILYLPNASALAGGQVVIDTSLPSSMAYQKFDLNDNAMVFDYSGTSPISKLRTYLSDGYNDGDWSGTNGIASTTAQDDPALAHGIAYREATDLFDFSGDETHLWYFGDATAVPVDSTTLLAQYDWLGDINFDGTVDAEDFDLIRQDIAAYATLDSTDRATYATWSHGDFNYDGVIDEKDIDLMVNSYNQIKNEYFDSLTGSSHNISLTATGTSSTDLANLNDALDDLNTAGGGTLTLDGMFNLGSDGLTLDTFSNIRIVSLSGSNDAGDGFTIEGVPEEDPGTIFHYGPGMIMMEHCTNIFFQNLEFDGNDQHLQGISSIDSQFITADDNQFYGLTYSSLGPTNCWAMYNWGDEYDHYTNNYTHDGPGLAFCGSFADETAYDLHGSAYDLAPIIVGNCVRQPSTTAINGHMHDALIADNDIDGLDAYDNNGGGTGIALAASKSGAVQQSSENCVIIGNYVQNMAGQGFQSDVLEDAPDVHNLNCTVMGNTFNNSGQDGMLIDSAWDWTIVNNICDANLIGIQIEGTHTLLLDGNSFTNSTRVGIEIDANDMSYYIGHAYAISSDSITIENNTISGNAESGIYIYALDSFGLYHCTISDIQILNNEIINNLSNGIDIDILNSDNSPDGDPGTQIDSISIEDNDLSGNSGYWLYENGLYHGTGEITNVTYDGNSISGNGYSDNSYEYP